MKDYFATHQKAFGLLGALAASIIAVMYLIFTPEEARAARGVQWAVLMYGHALCWFLLSGSSLLWGISKTNKWSAVLAYAALTAYVIFMGTLFIS